ncbi:UvrB/UvrC motif-containing protein, partial [Klebsiella pneumoniae]
KRIKDLIDGVYSEESGRDDAKLLAAAQIEELSEKDLAKRMAQLERQMLEHARNLEFEQAARLRDQLAQLREQAFGARVQD